MAATPLASGLDVQAAERRAPRSDPRRPATALGLPRGGTTRGSMLAARSLSPLPCFVLPSRFLSDPLMSLLMMLARLVLFVCSLCSVVDVLVC